MSAFPASAMGLPSALKYDLPPSMSDTARSYSVNVAPDGITSVTGAVGNISFTANAVTQSQFSSQVVSFTIPSGMSESVFLDCMNTTVSFTLTYTVGTASSVANGTCRLLSNAASWFDTLVLYSNNTPLETVNQYGLLQNYLLQNTVNLSERTGGVSICMGTDSNSAGGLDLPTAAAASYRFNFCIPLISLIGINTEKYFPIGSVNNMQLQLTTANLCPIVTFCTAVTTNVTLSVAPTLSEFRLNMKYLDVGDVAASMLRQTLQDGKWYIKSSSYTNSAVTIPSGSAGNQQALLQIRNSSVKSVFHQFGIATGLVSPNGSYDAINIGTTSRQLQVGGNYYPNLPINDVQRPAEGYAVLIQSLGGSIPKAYGTTVSREMYNSIGGIAAVPTGADNGLILPAVANNRVERAAPAGSNQGGVSVLDYPSGAFYGYDLEKVGGVLFSGINTRASPPFLNLFLGSALNANVTTQAWGLSDVVMVVDTGSKSVQAFI
jgi:hypothetical protein